VKPDDYLTAPRLPLFKDYFDERLRMVVHVPGTVRQVQSSFGYQPADLPG
jgi:histidyl-tRNA synthetase